MREKIFRYEEVVSKIEEQIGTGNFAPGDKVPSVRKLSEELQVSMSTIFQAYAILEAQGIIIAKPKSGYYVACNLQTSKPETITSKGYIPLPAKVEINEMATNMMMNSRIHGAVNFSILSPVNEFLPITKLNKAVHSALKETGSVNFQYPLVEGHSRLLKQVALRSIHWPIVVPADDYLITNGCMEAINLCLDAVCKPGDTVAVESPTYHGLLQSLEARNLKILEIPTHPETGISIPLLEEALEANKVNACVLMPRASNPTGSSMPEEAKKQLAELVARRQLPLIEDDALGELQFTHTGSLPVKAYDQAGYVLYCSSFSKTLAPGFRIGWLSAGRYHKAIKKLKFGANISTNAVLQDAIGRYLESGQYNSHLRKMIISLQCQVNKYIHAIQEYFPKEIKMAKPAAGYSLWIELPSGVDSIALQGKALELGIGLCPGYIFSMTGLYNNFIRINCCPLWNIKTEKAIEKLGILIEEMSNTEGNSKTE